LGEIYRDGVLVAADQTKARDFFQKAADAGNGGGVINLGRMLVAGQGGPADITGGIAMIEPLAADGNSWAL
ncbi:sel1 repeat family protein, partial [Rhizobium sp. AQ_MP]|nr:sel1 repeat family protein [Rhizobium sp. AQ_MP]